MTGDRDARPLDVLRALEGRSEPLLALVGDPAFEGAWGPLVATRARLTERVFRSAAATRGALERVERRASARRAAGGTSATGIALLLSFECLDDTPDGRPGPAVPDLVAIEVDASVVWSGPTMSDHDREGSVDSARSSLRDALATGAAARAPHRPRALRARTSLPRKRYLAAVERIRGHILAGDIYQANLTQMLEVDSAESPVELFGRLLVRTPAPRAALVAFDDCKLVSVSPEVFLDVDADGRVETLPIKGTRPRSPDAVRDRAAARDLLGSEKDRAELLMIVDLERNDLGRVCATGSVSVPELMALRSFPAVHHLVARVAGRLRPGVGIADLVAATFPGGSISGAPKRRALEILRGQEPQRRGWYTGSLVWLGDDGTARSSILIRSVMLAGGRAWVGAGGGIVSDSVPDMEWRESNTKARALAEALGFDPEDAA